MGKSCKLGKIALIVGAGAAISTIGYLGYKYLSKMSDDEFEKACLYMAVMDDEIKKNEKNAGILEEEDVEFDSRRDSLKYRYDLFSDLYYETSRLKLEHDIKKMEKNLEKSKELISLFDLDLDEEA